jgi:hypothetical protein
MSAATFVAKRFLRGVAGDLVNADYIVRLYVQNGKLYADMQTGPPLELATVGQITTAEQLPETLFVRVSM